MLLILHMRKLKLREVKWLKQGHTGLGTQYAKTAIQTQAIWAPKYFVTFGKQY